MVGRKIVAGLFLAGAALCIYAAAARMARGDAEAAVFFAVGAIFVALVAVFIALSGALKKKAEGPNSSPPAA